MKVAMISLVFRRKRKQGERRKQVLRLKKHRGKLVKQRLSKSRWAAIVSDCRWRVCFTFHCFILCGRTRACVWAFQIWTAIVISHSFQLAEAKEQQEAARREQEKTVSFLLLSNQCLQTFARHVPRNKLYFCRNVASQSKEANSIQYIWKAKKWKTNGRISSPWKNIQAQALWSFSLWQLKEAQEKEAEHRRALEEAKEAAEKAKRDAEVRAAAGAVEKKSIDVAGSDDKDDGADEKEDQGASELASANMDLAALQKADNDRLSLAEKNKRMQQQLKVGGGYRKRSFNGSKDNQSQTSFGHLSHVFLSFSSDRSTVVFFIWSFKPEKQWTEVRQRKNKGKTPSMALVGRAKTRKEQNIKYVQNVKRARAGVQCVG